MSIAPLAAIGRGEGGSNSAARRVRLRDSPPLNIVMLVHPIEALAVGQFDQMALRQAQGERDLAGKNCILPLRAELVEAYPMQTGPPPKRCAPGSSTPPADRAGAG